MFRNKRLGLWKKSLKNKLACFQTLLSEPTPALAEVPLIAVPVIPERIPSFFCEFLCFSWQKYSRPFAVGK